jgi:hypothetical protein
MFKLTNETINFFWSLPSSKPNGTQALCMTICPQLEKAVVAYETNHICVFDLNNKCLHEWSRTNGSLIPSNFKSRYNRLIGVTALNENKFLFYSNYTFTILDLTIDLP